MYSANEIAGKSNPAANGLFKEDIIFDDVWDLDYTFANGTLTFATIFGTTSVTFSISGNTATLTAPGLGGTYVMEFERVSSPTVAEIKAAKDPFVEGAAVLTLSPDKLTIKVTAKTENGTPIAVEGCIETTPLTSGVQTTLTAKNGTTVTLIGKITELTCTNNRLTALNVQGLTDLQVLRCYENKLATLDVQGLTDLQELNCSHNQLTSLNVQGCSSLKKLFCESNKLNADAFTKIFGDLPERQAGDSAQATLYTEETDVEEGNCTDFSDPATLKAAFENARDVKHWTMFKNNIVGDEDEI